MMIIFLVVLVSSKKSTGDDSCGSENGEESVLYRTLRLSIKDSTVDESCGNVIW